MATYSRLLRGLVVLAVCCLGLLGVSAPAEAAGAASAQDSMTCEANEQVEIAVNWVGRTVTVNVYPDGDYLRGKRYVFNGSLVDNFSVVRTRLPRVSWVLVATGTNGFDPPSGLKLSGQLNDVFLSEATPRADLSAAGRD